MIFVIDDFLDQEYADKLESEALGTLRYGYAPSLVTSYVQANDPNILDNGFWTCQLCNDYDIYWNAKANPCSWYIKELMPLVYKVHEKIPGMEISHVGKITSNVLMQQKDADPNHYSVPHWDADGSGNHYSMIYYVHDCDGSTVLFNEFHNKENGGKVQENLTVMQRVKPKKNRLLVFESQRYHSASYPIDSPMRIIFNFIMRATYTEKS